jgi:hypothetical protein
MTAQDLHHFASSTNSVASRANRLRHLQQRRFVVVNPPAKAQYVFFNLICFLNMYLKFLAMLLVLTSMLDLCMLVSVFIIIYFIANLMLHMPVFSTEGVSSSFNLRYWV